MSLRVLFTSLWGVVTVALLSACSNAEEARVFIVAGQSNALSRKAVGRQLPPPLQVPNPEIGFWYNFVNNSANSSGGDFVPLAPLDPTGFVNAGPLANPFFGPELTMANVLDENSASPLFIVKVAQGGTALEMRDGADDWSTGSRGEIFDLLLFELDSALAILEARGLSPTVEGLAWMQGEADANESQSATDYAQNMADLIEGLRSRYNPSMLVVQGEINSRDGFERAFEAELQAAQAKVADEDPLVALVPTGDLSHARFDNSHFDSASIQVLGARFAEALLALAEQLGQCSLQPVSGCLSATRGNLVIDERVPGRERLRLNLGRFSDGIDRNLLGDPESGTTSYSICLYGGEAGLVANLVVGSASEQCPDAECWSPNNGQLRYRDPFASADGISKITVKSGAWNKGLVKARAFNNTRRDLNSLPVGIALDLVDESRAEIQVVTSDAGCFGAELLTHEADGKQFRAYTP